MKLCLLTYNIPRAWSMPRLVQAARTYGFSALELRCEQGHGHGVELDVSPEDRRRARSIVQDGYLEIAGLGTSARFESPDLAERQRQVDSARRFIELAADVGAGFIKVFGNDVPAGVDRGDCSAYVADALRTLGEFAEPAGINVLLEMHGEFNYWGLARDTMRLADHPRVGLIYNSDPRDIAAGSVAATYSHVRQWIRHVHIAEFSGRYPYAELFDLLKADRYDRYLAAEISKEIPPPEEYLATYSAPFRAWAGQPFFPIGD